MELKAEQLGTRHPWILPNVKIYANPLTNQKIMAGHMGIESELVDADYPTFLVYNKTWEKMKEDFYSTEETELKRITHRRRNDDGDINGRIRYSKSNNRRPTKHRRDRLERSGQLHGHVPNGKHGS